MLDARIHIANTDDNLQLLADFACATMTLLVCTAEGLQVKDSVPPTTFSPSVPAHTIGSIVTLGQEGEAYACVDSGTQVLDAKTDKRGGISYVSYAYPIGVPSAYAVLVRDVPSGVSRDFGTREEVFISVALHLIKQLKMDALRDARTLLPFATSHVGADVVFLLDGVRKMIYSSPNVGTMIPRSNAIDPDTFLSTYRTYDYGVACALSGAGCSAFDLKISGNVLSLRILPCRPGALILMENVTELRDYERELRVKEVTIREVHHRVKNNLQTIESLLRMQIRRTSNKEVEAAFSEAITRISAMAVAHDMLSYSSNESVQAAPLAQAIAQQVMYGIVGSDTAYRVIVNGDAGLLDVHAVNSFALAIAEIVHNAFEHGFKTRNSGYVEITFTQVQENLCVSIEDNGVGLPDGFSLETGKSMGLMLMRTLVEDDLSGKICCGASGHLGGAAFHLRIPLSEGTI